jgi:tRNA(adenine34) deaminase
MTAATCRAAYTPDSAARRRNRGSGKTSRLAREILYGPLHGVVTAARSSGASHGRLEHDPMSPADSERVEMASAFETRDEYFMQMALEEADRAAEEGEVPVGCVLIDAGGREIARGHNRREIEADPTAHAETLAIREAAARIGGWRLEGVTAYVTLEPCAMCAGALVHARVGRLVYGCTDPKGGAVDTMFGIGRDARLNHRFEVTAGILGDACAERLRRFFAGLRARSP